MNNSIDGSQNLNIYTLDGFNYQGSTGSIGPTGSVGAQGIQGPTGATGSTGAQGLQGIQGPTGTQGVQGPQGSQGIQGPTGSQGSIGETGPQGIQGPTGSQGVQGNIGPTGMQGPQGLQGPQGTAGGTGTTGFIGPTGPQGVQGPQGIAGSTGPQGSQGNIGATGAQGQIGPTGQQGQQGVQGEIGPTGMQGIGGQIGPTGSFDSSSEITCKNLAVNDTSAGNSSVRVFNNISGGRLVIAGTGGSWNYQTSGGDSVILAEGSSSLFLQSGWTEPAMKITSGNDTQIYNNLYGNTGIFTNISTNNIISNVCVSGTGSFGNVSVSSNLSTNSLSANTLNCGPISATGTSSFTNLQTTSLTNSGDMSSGALTLTGSLNAGSNYIITTGTGSFGTISSAEVAFTNLQSSNALINTLTVSKGGNNTITFANAEAACTIGIAHENNAYFNGSIPGDVSVSNLNGSLVLIGGGAADPAIKIDSNNRVNVSGTGYFGNVYSSGVIQSSLIAGGTGSFASLSVSGISNLNNVNVSGNLNCNGTIQDNSRKFWSISVGSLVNSYYKIATFAPYSYGSKSEIAIEGSSCIGPGNQYSGDCQYYFTATPTVSSGLLITGQCSAKSQFTNTFLSILGSEFVWTTNSSGNYDLYWYYNGTDSGAMTAFTVSKIGDYYSNNLTLYSPTATATSNSLSTSINYVLENLYLSGYSVLNNTFKTGAISSTGTSSFGNISSTTITNSGTGSFGHIIGNTIGDSTALLLSNGTGTCRVGLSNNNGSFFTGSVPGDVAIAALNSKSIALMSGGTTAPGIKVKSNNDVEMPGVVSIGTMNSDWANVGPGNLNSHNLYCSNTYGFNFLKNGFTSTFEPHNQYSGTMANGTSQIMLDTATLGSFSQPRLYVCFIFSKTASYNNIHLVQIIPQSNYPYLGQVSTLLGNSIITVYLYSNIHYGFTNASGSSQNVYAILYRVF